MTDVLKEKDEGTAAVYKIDKNTGWDIAKTVLRWEDCETIEENRVSNYMLTTVGQNFISEGRLVGVWVEPVNDEETKITIVTKRKVQTNLATGLTESTFQESFSKAVEMVKAGKSLPIEKPSFE
ncbi:MAG: hypothetical protein R3250_16525 [Melioribacteraceae bacterium]|nr:hypothetical protein [Melioribacteraceae bacterium]